MNLLQAIILAIIEGLTEFLPVSSTGHMIIGSTLMGIEADRFVKVFTVAIQFGAILSVVVLYWRRFFQNFAFYVRLFVAFLPAVVFGLLLKKQIDALLEEAVATYVGRAAEKLRRQGSLAGAVQVYIRTNPFKEDHPQYQRGLTVPLPEPADDTRLLACAALMGLRRLYKPGYAYQKAGVMLLDLSDAQHTQTALFDTGRGNPALMRVMDRINAHWGRGTLRLAAEGVPASNRDWRMRRGMMSPCYTTRWAELPVVR